MFLRELALPIDRIRGAGPAALRVLARAGVEGVGALLCRYPRDWEDRSRPAPLRDFSRGPVCTEVTVLARDWFYAGKKRTLKIHVEDESGRAALICFNRPFLETAFTVGGRYRLWGRFAYRYGELQCSAFETEPVLKQESGFGAILPVYPLGRPKPGPAPPPHTPGFGSVRAAD